jgi:hypothetical protein
VNKKILGITFALVIAALMMTPVLAVSPKKIPVTIQRSGAYWIPPPPENVWVSGNVQHGRGFTGGWNTFNIVGDSVLLTGSLETYYGSYNVNLENGQGLVLRKMVITFDGGTFEGNNIQRGIFQMVGPTGAFPLLVDGTVHMVLHGTEDYLGWTFVRTRQVGEPWESYLLIP